MRFYHLFCLVILFSSCTQRTERRITTKAHTKSEPKAHEETRWVFERISGSNLQFSNGKRFNTNLFDLSYIGQVSNENKAPYLILSGRDCEECDANISIYIHSPSNGDLEVEHGQNRYQYPGVERDYENKTPLYQARAFYGQVLPHTKGVIWYQKQLMEDNSWQKSIFLVTIGSKGSQDTIIKDSGQLQQTLALMKKGHCTEIKGLEYSSEP